MASKTTAQHPEDDWAGLAQNLFGINLENNGSDDDLMNEDLFQVDIPKPPAPIPPPVAIPVAAPIVASVEPGQPAAAVRQTAPSVAVRQAAPKKPIKKTPPTDDPFGAGILDDDPGSSVADEVDADFDDDADDGITLAEDFDAEGLTLPSDYDDGLTLPPEMLDVDESADRSIQSRVRTDADATDDDLSVDDADQKTSESVEAASDRPRRRKFRKREDAYWDLLENWEWEEIPDGDAPRGDSDRSRSRRDDRCPRRGQGDDRRSRESSPSVERPRPDSASRPAQSPRGDETKSGDRSESRSRSRSTTPSESNSTRPGNDRPPRRRDRDESADRDRPRRESRERGNTSQTSRPAAPPSSFQATSADQAGDDFAFGIFDDERPVRESRSESRNVVSSNEDFPPAAESEDRLTDERCSNNVSINDDDDLVWGDDDSDVRMAPASCQMGISTSRERDLESFDPSPMPAAESADDSDDSSDVEPIGNGDDGPRRRRRRRRRRRPDGDRPSEGDGTTFDLNDPFATESESTADSADSDALDGATSEDETTESDDSGDEGSIERRGRRRRRRRRRGPGDGPSASSSDQIPADAEGEDHSEIEAEGSEESDEVALPQINYGKVPSWEEAIKYMLNPNLVGRNLGPDDEFESLEGDPRGSGGSEPTHVPPQRRFRSGGGGRGRRPSSGGPRGPRPQA